MSATAMSAPRTLRCALQRLPVLSRAVHSATAGSRSAPAARPLSAGLRYTARRSLLAFQPQRRGFAAEGKEKEAAEGQEKKTAGEGAADAEVKKADAGAEKTAGEPGAAGEGKESPAPTSAGGEAAAEEAKEPEESPLELLQKELAEVQDKVKAEKHSLLLALADFENNKKKNIRERESRKRTATLNFATKVVEVYHEFDELAHSEDKAEHLSEACQALAEGIALTRDLYRSTLDKFDVVLLQPEVGDTLLPARHDNVGSVEDANLAANVVAEVVKPGWILEPNSAKPVVLKKAQVKVARHGPATPPPPQ